MICRACPSARPGNWTGQHNEISEEGATRAWSRERCLDGGRNASQIGVGVGDNTARGSSSDWPLPGIVSTHTIASRSNGSLHPNKGKLWASTRDCDSKLQVPGTNRQEAVAEVQWSCSVSGQTGGGHGKTIHCSYFKHVSCSVMSSTMTLLYHWNPSRGQPPKMFKYQSREVSSEAWGIILIWWSSKLVSKPECNTLNFSSYTKVHCNRFVKVPCQLHVM